MPAATWPQGFQTQDANKLLDYATVDPTSWTDLISNTGTAATYGFETINGIPVLRVTVPATNTKWECGLASGLSLAPGWDGEFGALVYFPEAKQNTNIVPYIGSAGWTDFTQLVVSGTTHVDPGWRFCRTRETASGRPGHPVVTGTVTQANVVRGKIRINRTVSDAEETVYIAFGGFAAKERPTLLFGVDDGIASVYDWLLPELVARNIPCSYGIHSDLVDTGGYVTSAQVQDIYNHSSGLFHVYSHSTGNDNSSSLGINEYAFRVGKCAQFLRDLGCVDPDPMFYHPLVQGVHNQGLSKLLMDLGCRVCRTAGGSWGDYLKYIYSPYTLNGSGFETMQIPTIMNLNSSLSLADATAEIDDLVRLRRTGFMYGHGFVTSGPGATSWLRSDMTTLLDYIVRLRNLGMLDTVSVLDWYTGRTQPALIAA